MTSLVRGGAYVANTGPNAGVPTAPPLSLSSFFGGSGVSALTASKSGDASGSVFMPEPAPSSATVGSNTVTVFASGGTGSYTYTWAYLSGDAGIAISGGSTGPAKSWSKSVGKNATVNAVWRCTVNDGVNSILLNVSISLTYFTDL